MSRDIVALILGICILALVFTIPLLPTLLPGTQGDWYGLPVQNTSTDVIRTSFRDPRGEPVRLADFHGRFVFLFFGYTRCHESCPVWLSRLLRMAEERTDLHVLFLTIDPRDTPEFLNGYLDDARDRVTVIPADQNEIAHMARGLGYRFGVSTLDGETIHHQDAVYLFDRAGRLRLMYPYRYIDPRKLNADLNRLKADAQSRADRDAFGANGRLTADYSPGLRPRRNW